MKRIKILLAVITILNTGFIFAQFPQKQVNSAYNYEIGKLKSVSSTNILSEKSFNSNNEIIEVDIKSIKEAKATYSIGLNDTLLVDNDTTINGDILIKDNGVLIVDNATLTLYGHLIQTDSSKAYVVNNAYLYVPQLFNAQFMHILHHDSYFETSNSKIFANTVYQIRHFDNSEYIATNTEYPNWDFHLLWNKSKWIIEGVEKVGDMTINDSSEVHFIKCDTIMPWFGVAEGGIVDIQFPDYHEVEHYVFDKNLTGVTGVDIKVTFDTCSTVLWGFDSWPGSSINVINSNWTGVAFRIYEDATIKNVYDYTVYPSFSMPLSDRTFTLSNTYLHFWFPYVYDTAVVYIDSSQYAESKAHDNSEIYFTNTISDGFPSNTSPVDNGFISFKDGVMHSFCSVWHNATLYHSNSSVKKSASIKQYRNIAHHHSYFLAVNSYYDYEPEAFDTSLVMFALIDTLDIVHSGNNLDISGSAWIEAGPDNSPMITFDRYELSYCLQSDTIWSLIDESTSQVNHALLSTWNTTGINRGDYLVKLTIWDSEGDSLSALRPLTLIDSSTNINPINNYSDYNIYPNPATGVFTVEGRDIQSIEIANIRGQIIHSEKYSGETNTIPVNISNYAKGLYFIKIAIDDKFVCTKKIVIQ
ncbi:MAG: T9SS type A sorting domain-containing protein [Bacteroidales bacterium]|nr:T9SS type A sorting domain-containing protein [Bacteroidales bacterium]